MMRPTKVAHIQSLVSHPTAWAAKYTDNDKANVCKIIDWLNAGQSHEPGYENQRSQSKLALAARVSQSGINQILTGKYPSPVTDKIKTMLDYIDREGKRDNSVSDVVIKTSVYNNVYAACTRAHHQRMSACISAVVGTGKTVALNAYAAEHPNTLVINCTPDMNASVLANQLVKVSGAAVSTSNRHSSGTKAEKIDAVINQLTGSDALLVIDEAETVSAQTLEYVRRVSDLANIGVVYAGTDRLQPLLRPRNGRFAQIGSRITFWPPVIKGIEADDARAIAEALLPDVTLDNGLHDAMWQVCDGSARVLCKGVIPGIRDYVLRPGKPLTKESVFKVGHKLLGYQR